MKFQQFILLGLPGMGVEEQAIELANRKHLPHVSMGDLLRQAIAAQSDLGRAAQPAVAAGELVPDALVMKLLRRRMEQPDVMLNGWVLSGFPRTVAQAEAYDELLTKLGVPAPTVVHLQAMTGLLINRLWNDRQPDDTMSTIRQRLTQQQAALQPIVEYYEQRSRLTTVNGSLPFAEVAGKLSRLGPKEAAVTWIKDEAELDSLLSETSLLVVDGMASWCGPCKLVAPLIDQLAANYGDRARVMKMDFDVNKQIPKRFELQGMPAVMFFKNGQLQETLTGVKPYTLYSDTVTRFLE